MRMRISSNSQQNLHYAGPEPTANAELLLAGSSRLDEGIAEQLFHAASQCPAVFLSHNENERPQGRNGGATSSQQEREELMEQLAGNLMAAGARAVVAIRWPVNTLRVQEFFVLLYQELADGIAIGESMRRARSTMVQRH